MKRVFSSHSEVTHVWAQQKQEEGRAGSVFFRDTTNLYSYGFHYLMAQIHTVKGKRFALVNSYVYSNSTAKHLGATRSALRGLMPYFEVSNPSNIKQAVKDLDLEVLKAIDAGMSRKYFADSHWSDNSNQVEYILSAVTTAYSNARAFRALLGRAPAKFPSKKFKELEAHLAKLVEKYNSPARVAKRQAREGERRELERQRREEDAKETAEELVKFRAGGEYSGYRLNPKYDLLRIRGSRVETSRGAIVPLEEARKLLKRVQAGEAVNGVTIGEYTVNGVDCTDEACTDKIVSIGCHRILLSEAVNVLAKPAHLSLVGAS